jgi:hypothetical protein
VNKPYTKLLNLLLKVNISREQHKGFTVLSATAGNVAGSFDAASSAARIEYTFGVRSSYLLKQA